MDNFMVLVEVGAELPKVGGKLLTSSGLTGKEYEVTVKKIVGLRWNKSGALIVELSGTKEIVINNDSFKETKNE